jgi:hypothetical protein
MVGEGDGRFVFVDVQIQWSAEEMTATEDVGGEDSGGVDNAMRQQ